MLEFLFFLESLGRHVSATLGNDRDSKLFPSLLKSDAEVFVMCKLHTYSTWSENSPSVLKLCRKSAEHMLVISSLCVSNSPNRRIRCYSRSSLNSKVREGNFGVEMS